MWANAVVSFSATFFGVFLGWMASEMSQENSRSDLFDQRVSISKNYCAKTLSSIENINKKTKNSQTISLEEIPPPDPLIQYAANPDFIERVHKKIRPHMISARVETVGSIGGYNSIVRELRPMIEISEKLSFDPVKQVGFDAIVQSKRVQSVSAFIHAQRDVKLLCYALRAQECNIPDIFSESVESILLEKNIMGFTCPKMIEYIASEPRRF